MHEDLELLQPSSEDGLLLACGGQHLAGGKGYSALLKPSTVSTCRCGHVLDEQPPQDLHSSSATLGEQRQASHDITASSNL
eukprot:9497762-Pyramimonas_sp.AAC.2